MRVMAHLKAATMPRNPLCNFLEALTQKCLLPVTACCLSSPGGRSNLGPFPPSAWAQSYEDLGYVAHSFSDPNNNHINTRETATQCCQSLNKYLLSCTLWANPLTTGITLIIFKSMYLVWMSVVHCCTLIITNVILYSEDHEAQSYLSRFHRLYSSIDRDCALVSWLPRPD